MKRILALLLIPSVALADQPCVVVGTPAASGIPIGQGAPCGVNTKLQQYITTDGTPIPVAPSGASELVPSTMVQVLPTAVPTAFPTPQFAPVATGLKSAFVTNTTNVEIWCSFSSTNPHFAVPAGSTWTDNFAEKGIKMSVGIGCIRTGATPASGSVLIGGEQ